MHRNLSIFVRTTATLTGAAVAIAVPSILAGEATGAAHGAPTVVAVKAGSSSKLLFKLSTTRLSAGQVEFEVKDTGHVSDGFRLCSVPVSSDAKNSCTGPATKLLKPGQSTTLTVTLAKSGSYEYVSTLSSQAAAGMKGLIGVTAALVATTTTTAAPVGVSTTAPLGSKSCSGRCAPVATTTTITKPPGFEALIGDPTAGSPLYATNCASCHTLAAAGSTSTLGPNLDADAPSQEELVAYIGGGSDNMPAYGGTLTGTQVDDIAAYVYASTHIMPSTSG